MSYRALVLVAGIGCVAAVDAHAACLLPYSFANYGFTPSTYTYIHFGPDAVQSNDAIIGRYWKPGARDEGNEGFYDDSQWLVLERPDAWDFQGWLSAYGNDGCIRDGDMILVLQDTTWDGSDAVFVAGRVGFHGALEHVYPFWLTGDWDAVRFPQACRERQKRRGQRVTVRLGLDPLGGGFYGEAGMLATDTITGYTIWTATGTADPGRAAGAWSYEATVPYTGSPGESYGLDVECDSAQDVFVAVGLEFDHGQFRSDFVGKSTRIVCNRRSPDPADQDSDGTEDRCDNCPAQVNPDQSDEDTDGIGDACENPMRRVRALPPPTLFPDDRIPQLP